MITLKGNIANLEGTSGDQKPNDVPVNTIFRELDTNCKYYFTGETWVEIPGGGGGGGSGTSNYNELENKPQIAGVTLSGNKTLANLGIQGELTFDDAPTDGSSNPVTSDGIYEALGSKQGTLTFDDTPTDGSSNPVTSDGIFEALSGKQASLSFEGTYNADTNKAATESTVSDAIEALSKSDVGLDNVTNNEQVKAVSGAVTSGGIVTFGADGATVSDSGKTIATSITDSNSTVPTSKAIVDNAAGSAKLTNYSTDSSQANITASSTVTDAIEQLDYRTTTNKNNILSKCVVCTCSTASGTAEKVVDAPSGFVLQEGCIIGVKFGYSNGSTTDNVTLNVNGTGAKPIYYQNGVYTSHATKVTGYANFYIFYMYDGTNWVWLNYSFDAIYTYMSQSEASAGTATNERLISAKVLSDTIDEKLVPVNNNISSCYSLKGITEISDDTDLNDLASVGNFYKASNISSISNKPADVDTSSPFRLDVIYVISTGYRIQYYTEWKSGKKYSRIRDTEWSPWKLVEDDWQRIADLETFMATKYPVTITTQPTAQSGAVGETAVFTVAATGAGLVYQWNYKADSTSQYQPVGFGDKTKPTLNVPITAARDGMTYACKVYDAANNIVMSDGAVLTVTS